ncbi:MAG: acyl transferase [Bacteroidales bacterium]|nr:acyl transferase [Bacteroidales bacterium]
MFSISSASDFEKTALEIFRQQYQSVKVYHDFVNYLGIDAGKINILENIPFLPVELFKFHKILSANQTEEIVFTSSGTTGSNQSKHYVAGKSLYEESFIRAFTIFYGSVSDYCILALLPSYLERSGSSLVYMMDRLIKMTGHPDSGFYLDQHDALVKKVVELKKHGQKTLLLGVSFALLELAEKYSVDLSGVIIMETGGMKGRGTEITREELHRRLKNSLNVKDIHSEYGMTELLSQAYSKGNGIFHTPPWMKILTRDSHDPFAFMPPGRSGAVNIIDLANIRSCAFIATSDLGKTYPDGGFEILGRMDNRDIRGCNLMIP